MSELGEEYRKEIDDLQAEIRRLRGEFELILQLKSTKVIYQIAKQALEGGSK